MTINKKISEYFEEQGFSVRAGNNRRKIKTYEDKPNLKKIFTLFRKYPIYRVIYQMIYDEIPLTSDEILFELTKEKLKSAFSKSPLVNLNCPNCGFVMGFYNPYLQKKPKRKQKCTYCHIEFRLNECDEEEDWNLPHNQVHNIFKKYIELQLLESKYYGYCIDHGAQDIDIEDKKKIKLLDKNQLANYIFQFYCKKCNKLNEVDISYTKGSMSDYFDDGVWLEAYLKNLISLKKDIIIENSLRVIDSDNVNYEIDVIILYKNKIYCIECKAIRPTKKIGLNELSYIEKWKEFSDYVIISTTGKIKDRDKKILSRDDIQIVEQMNVEKIITLFK